MRYLLILLCLLPALGCDDGSDGPEPLAVSLGSGLDDFVPVTDPQTRLRITEGIQGGYHVYGSLLVPDMDRFDATVEFQLWQGDTQIGAARYLDDFLRAPDGVSWVYPGVTVFLFDRDFPPESVAGTVTRMTATVTDRDGRTGSAEISFTPVCCDYLP